MTAVKYCFYGLFTCGWEAKSDCLTAGTDVKSSEFGLVVVLDGK